MINVECYEQTTTIFSSKSAFAADDKRYKKFKLIIG